MFVYEMFETHEAKRKTGQMSTVDEFYNPSEPMKYTNDAHTKGRNGEVKETTLLRFCATKKKEVTKTKCEMLLILVRRGLPKEN